MPAGATCTIDVTYAPTFAQPAFPRTTTLLVPFKDAAFTPNPGTPYVELHGTGIPATAFSRLSFEPRKCTFRTTTVGTTSAPVRFNARSSGSLPLTIDSVAGGGARFPLLATTCAVGMNLQPGAACTLDMAFRPSVAGVVSNAANIEYHASDAPANSAMSMPLNGTGLTGDAVFVDSFEAAMCSD